MSRTTGRTRDFQDSAKRIYMEVEDVGKTVKASKRRARWTFSFGDDGEEKEVILLHSVVSGKKTLSYEGREIYHSDEMSRAFSYNWYDGDHILRVDIVDIVEVGSAMARNGNDRMYELTIDGVPFSVLPIKPVQLPGRRGGERSRTTPASHRATASADDDFDPRGKGQGHAAPVKARMKAQPSKPQHSAQPVDLLGGLDDPPAPNPTFTAPGGFAEQSFDPFAATGMGATMSPPAPAFDPFGATKAPSTLTAQTLARELEGLSFSPAPQRPLALPAPTPDFGGFQGAVNLDGDEASGAPGPADVDKATRTLVNLKNLLDDAPVPVVGSTSTSTYKPAYTDNRSLEEIKSAQGHKASQHAKPIMIERPAPAFGPPRPPMPIGPGGGLQQPLALPAPGPGFQQKPMGMGMGMAPRPMGMGMGPGFGPGFPQQQAPPMMMPMGAPRPMGLGPGFQQPMPPGPGFGAAPGTGMGMGLMPPPPTGPRPGFPSPPRPGHDAFAGLGGFP